MYQYDKRRLSVSLAALLAALAGAAAVVWGLTRLSRRRSTKREAR